MDYQTYSSHTTGFDGEGQITSAIGYVTSEDLPILYTLEGHGEKEMDSTIKEDIEKANMDIQIFPRMRRMPSLITLKMVEKR